MKERPILFSAPMVRAILAGTKTQTRRIVKPQPVLAADAWKCRYGAPGDWLLVAAEIPSSPNDDYCAGTDGLIYSRTRYAGFGRKERVDWYAMTSSSKGKYPSVTLCHENKKATRNVHALVCEAFYGLAPFRGAQVRHLDGDRLNSAPVNLAWGTQQENWADRKAHGNGCEGEKHHAAKLSDEDRAHVRWAIARGLCSRRHAASALGMSPSSVQAMCDGAEIHAATRDVPSGRISRITLEVTSVRVERLQAITDRDALAEGIQQTHVVDPGDGTAVQNFSLLWDRINGKRASWASNPWVWVVGFERLQAHQMATG